MSIQASRNHDTEDRLASQDLAMVLGTDARDPRQFLRRVLDAPATAQAVVCALLEDPEDEGWWLARATSADEAVRSYLSAEGFEGAATARAVEVGEARAVLDDSAVLRVLRSGEGRRLVLVHADNQSVPLDSVRWGLALLESELRARRLRDEATDLRERLGQIRSSMRAAVRSAQAFVDLDGAARWLCDLRQRLEVEAAALFVDDHGDAMVLTDIESTSELAEQFLSRAAKRVETPRDLRCWDLRDGSRTELRLRGTAALDEEAWPSFECVPATGPRGESMWVVLGSRLPQRFAPESIEMLRSAVGSMARDLGQLLEVERRRRDELSTMLREIPLGLMLVGEDGRLIALNQETRELLGLDGEAPDLFALSRGLGADLGQIRAATEELASGEVYEQRLALDRLDRTLSLQVRAVHASPERRQWLWTLRDDSVEQRRERARAEFVSTVGHELKTPLTSMQTALELMDSGELGALTCEQAHFVQLGLRGCERLGLRVEQLLDMSRFEHGRLQLEPESTELGEALRPSVEELTLRAQREARQFDCELPEGVMAFVDGIRVGEIVENLVGNAFKFCPRSGRVSLQLRRRMPAPRPGDRQAAELFGVTLEGAEIAVQDNGEGMSPSTLQHVFDPFYQEGDPLSDRPEGVGLGLAIVRALVRGHHGEIEIDSERGKGTAVRVWLPADAAAFRLRRGLEELRAAIEEATARAHPLRVVLRRSSDPGSFCEGWELECGREDARAGECSVEFPRDGRRAGTLLAELQQRWTEAQASAESDRSGKARND